ncbi:MAG: FHA domain-containing protein [Planctomycetes bacterium]|nr:FHA domain-containing protein [Planctomycetota bacterium]
MPDIIITDSDLKDPTIDDMINLQKSLAPQRDEKVEEIKRPFYLHPIFYYSVASILGALVVWILSEPYHSEDNPHQLDMFIISDYLLFGPVAGMLSLSIGVVYGIVNGNWMKSLVCGVVGLGVGLGATMITTVIAVFAFIIIQIVAFRMNGTVPLHGPLDLRGLPFFMFVCGRGIAWSIVAMGAGLGLGVALKSRKLVLNGLVGGMLGGLIGGLFFDLISRFVVPNATTGGLSRGVGITAVGLFVGIFIGFFENISKEAWFQMLKGPLAGKHFILFKNVMRIGSSPKSDVYLFKDPDIAPLHATVTKSGTRFVLKDENSEMGIYVNGRKIDKYILQAGDTVTVGETVLRYHEKQRG